MILPGPTVCPDDTCLAPAEVVDDFWLDGSPTPVRHFRIDCTKGHHLTVPVT